MVTGRPPFEGDTDADLLRAHRQQPVSSARSVCPGVPLAVSQTIDRMLAKSPALRIQTACDLCDIIDEQCLHQAGIAQKLEVDEPPTDTKWEVKLEVNAFLPRCLTLKELRERYWRGQFTRDTPTRRAGSEAAYERACEFLELNSRVFHDTGLLPHQHVSRPSHEKLHDLLQHYEEQEARHRERRDKRRIKRWLVHGMVLLVIVLIVLLLWPQIRSMVAQELVGHDASTTLPAVVLPG